MPQPNGGASDYFVVMLSGDGGWANIDKDIVIVSAASCMEIWDTSIYNSIDNDGFDYVKAAEELLKD